METALQKNLKQKLEEQGLSAIELERRTGLKHSAIQNIIYGRSKRPGIDIVSAIAKELGCAIEDLLSENAKNPITTEQAPQKDRNLPWNAALFIEATQAVHKLMDQNQTSHNTDEVLFCIKEIYNYAIFSGKNKIDAKFTEWIIDKYLGCK